jgi:SAM-dependent methyltransferase
VGTREYFDEVEQRKYFVEPHIPAFADFNRWRGKRVLEIGCGIGTDTINFARAGATVTAVDLSEKSLEVARKRAEVFGLSDQVQFQAADAERLSDYVQPAVYDLVYAFGVIHHTPYPERVIAQVRDNFAATGTTLKLMVYNRRSWKVANILVRDAKLAFWDLDKAIAKSSEAQTGCPVTYAYTRKSVKQLLGAGFDVESIFVDHVFPYRVSKYVNYEYEKILPFRLMPKLMFRQLEKRFGWHLCVTAVAT